MSVLPTFPLKVDIVSDVVCPWCIIGYRQFLNGLELSAHRFEIDLHWQPFELNPQMPPEGQDLREHVAGKYGTTSEQSRYARSRLTEIGESVGFRFDYYEGMRMVNTFRAHQLLHWAGEDGHQTALKLALFEAFFRRRQDVNDPTVLAGIAEGIGLSASTALDVLKDGRYGDAVRKAQQHWLDRDVHAVPTFWFNDRFSVPGAQEPKTFARMLDKLAGMMAA